MPDIHRDSTSHSDTHNYPPLLERRPTFAEVDLRALAQNLKAVHKLVPNTGVIAIVKADAYGHGLIAIGKELERVGVDYLGAGFLEEGVALREAGVKLPILILGGVAGFQIDYFLEYDLELTASSHFIINEIDRRARRRGGRAKVHLKIDTGMNRIGVNYRRALEFLEEAAALPFIQVKGIYSHLAKANTDADFTRIQYQRLAALREPAQRIFNGKIPFHLLNSAGMLNFLDDPLDFVRPGLFIYGMNPDISYLDKTPVKPVMSLKSEVVFLKRVPPGEGISYDLTYTTDRLTTIATVPIGYGDGYPQRLSNCGKVLIGGKRYPIVGKVCMDQIMVNVGDDWVRIGEEVVLIGRQGNERITVEEICQLTGALPYEITIGIAGRVPRLYLGD